MQNYVVLEKNNAIYFINVVNWSIIQVNDRKTPSVGLKEMKNPRL